VSFSFESDFESSIAATRASNCLSLLASLIDHGTTAWVALDGEWDLRRVEGGSLTADEWDSSCDLFEKKSSTFSLDLLQDIQYVPFPFVVLCFYC
jgi:hypothetical protein